mmetsp:Transcript_83092/g.97093  ORF Transcript_83092/g.97093 Transcript_83092/m.97093 type:complete len:217 (+) Transcript_83092:303-953(+)
MEKRSSSPMTMRTHTNWNTFCNNWALRVWCMTSRSPPMQGWISSEDSSEVRWRLSFAQTTRSRVQNDYRCQWKMLTTLQTRMTKPLPQRLRIKSAVQILVQPQTVPYIVVSTSTGFGMLSSLTEWTQRPPSILPSTHIVWDERDVVVFLELQSLSFLFPRPRRPFLHSAITSEKGEHRCDRSSSWTGIRQLGFSTVWIPCYRMSHVMRRENCVLRR